LAGASPLAYERGIILSAGSWKFGEKITPIFDEHVRSHVPLYEEIHEMVTNLAGWFLEDNTNAYDIGTSLGEVIGNLNQAYPYKRICYHGIDTSPEMVAKTSERFSVVPNIKISNADITDSHFVIENASLITSILTLMFIAQKHRQSVVKKVYDGLNVGSAFIMVEKVIGSNARFDEMWIELYHEMKHNNGVSEADIFKKARAIRGVLKPNTVDENIKLLNSVGFKDVDMFFKWGNFAGFIAIK
jgi:tRNA (cmo5U34)-methyltransferase